MTTPSNGNGSGPDQEPQYGVRLPGAQPPQGNPGPDPAASGPQGWDTPRRPQPPQGNQTFGPYVPADYMNSRGGYPSGHLAPQARPKQVTAASIILWIAAGVYTLMMGSGLLMAMRLDLKSLLMDSLDTFPPDVADSYRTQLESLEPSALQAALTMTLVLVVVVGILAAVAAWRTWKGSNAWRIAGTVCGACMALYQVFMVLTSPILGLPGLAVCVVVLVLWFSKPATAWFRMKSAQHR